MPSLTVPVDTPGVAANRVDTLTRNRSFWWDRARCAHADVPALEAVIVAIDGVLVDSDRDGHLFRDLVWGLHCGGIRVAVVTSGRRALVEPLVRELLGDGVVEVMVTGDDVASPKPDPEVYERALHELGVHPVRAMAIEHSAEGLLAARRADLTTVVVTGDTHGHAHGKAHNQDFTGAAAVLSGYSRPQPLTVDECQRLRERWWIGARRLLSA